MRAFLLSTLFLSLPFLSDAWGKDGHHIVAEVAMNHMQPATKQMVLKLLGKTSAEDAATWMDDMRSNHDFDFMKPWHYIDFPRGTDYPAKTEENAVTEITTAYLELKHIKTLTPEQAKAAVMVLFHLVGDLHQPLHAGYAEDKGGNEIQLQYDGAGTNLHALWDEKLIMHYQITLADAEAKVSTLNTSFRESQSKIDVVKWMKESRSYLPQVYSFSDHAIDEKYGNIARLIITERLMMAGIRLAATLDDLFGGDAKH